MTAADEARTSAPGDRPPAFGFRDLEIFKVERSSPSLEARDVNGDGRLDYVLADNSEGTIQLMLQRSPQEIEAQVREAAGGEAPSKESVNEIESDARFRVEKFYTDKQVSSLRVGDFNGDGKPDLAFYSDPPELEIVYQTGRIWGTERSKFPIRDGHAGVYALNASDLNADGRLDLILLGTGKTYILYQKEGGGLQRPTALRNAQPEVSAVEAGDVNGDGRLDLVYFVPTQEEPVSVRLQAAAGFGPEIGSRLRPITAWFLARSPATGCGPAGATLLTVQRSNRRVKLYRWKERPTESGLSSPHLLAQRAEGDPDERRRILADVNADGRTDVLVSYPESAQLEVSFQDESGVLSRSVAYPTFAGVNGLASADVDGDGREEVIVASRKEKAVGVSRWKEGRLHFPEMVLPPEIKGSPEPVLVGAAPLRAGSQDAGSGNPRSSIVVIYEEKGPRTFLGVVSGPAEGGSRVLGRTRLELKGAPPSAMRLFDADRDGTTDVLLFVPYEDPFLFLQVAPSADDSQEGEVAFAEVSRRPNFGLGQISKLAPSALTVSCFDPRGDGSGSGGAARSELLVASKNYVRALRLDSGSRLQVLEQFSGSGAGSNLVGSAALELNGSPGKEVVLVNRAASALEILERQDDGSYELTSAVPLPKIDLARMETRDMNSDGREDLVLMGKQKTAILYAQGTQENFEEFLSYAVEEAELLGQPQDLTVGDLNGDGSPDLIVNTAPRYQLLFLTHRADASPESEPASFERRLNFPIFEEKTYMRRRAGLGPRQMLVADIDGDGLQDLTLLIHDRILLYLQDGNS